MPKPAAVDTTVVDSQTSPAFAPTESVKAKQIALKDSGRIDEYESEMPVYDEAYFSGQGFEQPMLERSASSNSALQMTQVIEPQKVNSPAQAVKTVQPVRHENQQIGDLPDWSALIAKLNVRGLVKQLAQQSELLVFDEHHIELRCENRALASNVVAVSGMQKALSAYFKEAPKSLKIHVGSVSATPAKVQAQVKEAELAGAQAIIAKDATVQMLVREFDGMVLPNSIKAI